MLKKYFDQQHDLTHVLDFDADAMRRCVETIQTKPVTPEEYEALRYYIELYALGMTEAYDFYENVVALMQH